MRRSKRIAIILSDTLQCVGLESLLTDFFSPVDIVCFPDFESLTERSGDSFDYYFTHPEIAVSNPDFFLPRRSKTILLLSHEKSGNNQLNLCSSREAIIEHLHQLLAPEGLAYPVNEGNKALSVREIDVLRLIVKGCTNKEIADKLNISLNTVLTHRKNITAKLGIKTVSGLTFYAIMHGIISGDEIEL